MKLKLLIIFIGLVLVSCSGDDNNEGNSPVLLAIKDTYYDKGVPDYELYAFYNTNNSINRLDYNVIEPNGTRRKDKTLQYSYDKSGLLFKIDYLGYESQLVSTRWIEYDNQRRVIKVTLHSVYHSIPDIESYIYNSDNTITVQRSFADQSITYYKYYLDSNGQIYKRVYDPVNNIKETVYSDGNIISETRPNGDMITYTFDNVNLPKLKACFPLYSVYDGNATNAILLNEFEDVTIVNNRYMTEKTRSSTSETETFQYTFNEQGYLTGATGYIDTKVSFTKEVQYGL